MFLMLTMYCLRTIRTVFCHCVLNFFKIHFNNADDYPNDVCWFTATSVKILRNRSIKTAESRHTENTLVNAKQIVQLLHTTVSNDEKPMSFFAF